MKDLFKLHRIVLLALAVALVFWCAFNMRWDWIPKYTGLIKQGIWQTIWLFAVTSVMGMALAVPLGLAQAAGPWYLARPA
ncbi:MAG: ABC transporter permease, partial [Albidovulum sp.]